MLIEKIHYIYIIGTFFLIVGCGHQNPEKPNSYKKPTAHFYRDSLVIGQNVDTTLGVQIHAPANIKGVKSKASNGASHVETITGLGSKNGSAKVYYKSPKFKGEFSISVVVTDENGQTGKSIMSVKTLDTPPNIKLTSDSLTVSPQTDTTLHIMLHAKAGIKDFRVNSTKGISKLKNISGLGAVKGTADLFIESPKKATSYFIGLTITDKKNQVVDRNIYISVIKPSTAIMQELASILENVTQATKRKFGVHDSEGHTMDTAKIIEVSEGEYIAVYHSLIGGNFKVFVASSPDLFNWDFKGKLGDHASQPYIKKGNNGGFFVAWEQDPNNHVRILYYKNKDKLFHGDYEKSYETSQTLSKCAEGTPNIIAATQQRIEVGMHYYKDCHVDREAKGVLKDFTTWNASINRKLNNSIIGQTTINKGKIGDRDQITFGGYKYIMVEAQLTLNDFGSWRCFLYNKETQNTEKLDIKTQGETKNFANPALTKVKINGKEAIVVSIYVPSDNAANGEAGQLIYYKYY